MSRPMSVEERAAFLLHGTRTGKLATVRRDGRPHVQPVWFVLDEDGTVVFMTGARTVKGRNLRRDPRASMVVDDEAPPFAYVRLDGHVDLSEDLDEMLIWSTRIAFRYMGPELAEQYGRRNAVPGELLVRLRPDHVVTEAGVAD
ncbi:MAG TPA: PPOX class F420-dependent oxidoreductase [Miltoncostaea sp.]|nr:PPOX class F420-dependent oxidoreductase [Miltoncostaea sp.]